MGREPIVRENRIRLHGRRRVVENVYGDPRAGQGRDRAIEFGSCPRCNRVRCVGHNPLEGIIQRRLRIRIKPERPDHDHGVRAWLAHHWFVSRGSKLRGKRSLDNGRVDSIAEAMRGHGADIGAAGDRVCDLQKAEK
jgi:hypothetical protein